MVEELVKSEVFDANKEVVEELKRITNILLKVGDFAKSKADDSTLIYDGKCKVYITNRDENYYITFILLAKPRALSEKKIKRVIIDWGFLYEVKDVALSYKDRRTELSIIFHQKGDYEGFAIHLASMFKEIKFYFRYEYANYPR